MQLLPPIRVLTESELRACVGLDNEALVAVEDGFTRLADGKATVPPIMMIEVPEHRGEVDVKSAYVKGLDSFAVKIASGFFDNLHRGLPSGSGMMVVIGAQTGFPQAVLLDNGFLTDLRTALAGAIAAKHLACEKPETVGVIGAGVQGRYQVRALQLVRDFRRVLVHDVRPEAVEQYVAEMPGVLGVEVAAAGGAAQLVGTADLVVTTTPSKAPLVHADWLHSGLHVTAVGSDSPEKQELDPNVLVRADRLVCDRKVQCSRLGELHHAMEAGLIAEDHPIDELGELAAGRKPGRSRREEITVCDLTGVGVQDTAIALLACRNAEEKGLGLTIGT